MSHRKNDNRGFIKTQGSPSLSNVTQQKQLPFPASYLDIWKKYRWVWAGIVVLTVLVYLNSLSNGFVSDDIGGIVQNTKINDFGYLFSSPLRALRFIYPTIHYLINQWFGLSPAAFRVSNILFHLGTVTLVFFTISRLTKPTIGAISATLTGIHPIMTESVTWISGGGHALYTFFAWIALFLLSITGSKRRYSALAVIACFMSVTVSEKAVVLPLLLLIFVWIYQNRHIKAVEIITLLTPAVIIGLIFVSKLSERSAWLQTNYYQASQQGNLLANWLVQVPVAVSSYLQLIFWPNGLTLYHSELRFSTFQFGQHVVLFISLIVTTILLFIKNRRLFFWLIVFIVGLAPTLTPFGVSWIVAERYVYFSAIGIFVVIGVCADWLISKNRGIGWVMVMLIVLALSIRTVTRNSDWKNQDTLWLATAKTSPSSPQNHNNLGDYYARYNNYSQAIEEFNLAIKLNPNYGDAYHNLGNVYVQIRNYDLALSSFAKAIAINPNLWQSYANIGSIYYQQNKFKQAEEMILAALKIVPNNDSLLHGIGVVYLAQGDRAKAIGMFQQALTLNPNNQLVKKSLAEVQVK